LAGLRSKQLLRGAQPRIQADPLRRRNTSIALEELKRGLIPFRPVDTLADGQIAEVVATVPVVTLAATTLAQGNA
jgi:DNA-directed RNA polymerase subunit K/omega